MLSTAPVHPGHLFYNARKRIDDWRVSAEKELELMAEVPCWLGTYHSFSLLLLSDLP